MNKEEIKLAINSYLNEVFDKEFYLYLSRKNKYNNKFILDLALTEEKHVKFWEKYLDKRKIKIPKYGIFLKIKLSFFKFLSKILGISFIVGMLELRETNTIINYSKILKKQYLDEDEKNELKEILSEEISHEDLILKERLKFQFDIKNVRDSLYGMLDALIEILALVAGLASVISNPIIVAIGGILGSFAGAFAMSAGAYISSKSQREIYDSERKKLEVDLLVNKENAIEKIKKYLISKNFEEKVANELINIISSNDEILYHFLNISENKFIEPEIENPIRAAKNAGIYYIIGALFPVLPFLLFLSGITGLIFSVLFSALGIGIASYIVSYISGSVSKVKILTMILIGLSAAAAAYSIGFIAKTILGIEGI